LRDVFPHLLNANVAAVVAEEHARLEPEPELMPEGRISVCPGRSFMVALFAIEGQN
jgi:hypothetical protein